jgi:hypothetical protein
MLLLYFPFKIVVITISDRGGVGSVSLPTRLISSIIANHSSLSYRTILSSNHMVPRSNQTCSYTKPGGTADVDMGSPSAGIYTPSWSGKLNCYDVDNHVSILHNLLELHTFKSSSKRMQSKVIPGSVLLTLTKVISYWACGIEPVCY